MGEQSHTQWCKEYRLAWIKEGVEIFARSTARTSLASLAFRRRKRLSTSHP